VIEILAKTLADFDEDHLIPAYGFGDSTTKDKQCFSFHEHNRPSNRVDEALCRYHQLCHAVGEEKIVLSGPTSFGPVIQEAIKTVVAEQSYHILVIIADGQVDLFIFKNSCSYFTDVRYPIPSPTDPPPARSYSQAK